MTQSSFQLWTTVYSPRASARLQHEDANGHRDWTSITSQERDTLCALMRWPRAHAGRRRACYNRARGLDVETCTAHISALMTTVRGTEAVDEALARLARIEATYRAQQQLTPAERALLPGAMFDRDDLAVLAAATRAFREGRGFAGALGLTGKWSARAKAQMLRDLIVQIPTKSHGPHPRAKEVLGRLRGYCDGALGYQADARKRTPPQGDRLPLFRMLQANNGIRPSKSTLYRAFSTVSPSGSFIGNLAEVPCAREDQHHGEKS